MTAISTSNLLWYLSGGAGNSNPVASLGGVISSTQWSTATALDDLFPDVTGAQAASGITQYLCLYFKNTDPNVNGLIAAGVYFRLFNFIHVINNITIDRYLQVTILINKQYNIFV